MGIMIRNFFIAWKGFRQFNALHESDREIVFYAEDSDSWVHYEPIISSLTKFHCKKICYLTSSLDDSILIKNNPMIIPLFIGDGLWRMVLFNLLRADIMVMTMPDLETFHIKRSNFPVHYIYIFHTILSTHMVFRKGAYDNYDTIFCSGPHHNKEIRKTEDLYSLKRKNLVNHGYGRIDSIIKSISADSKKNIPSNQTTILIAPSWGDTCILETCGIELIETLIPLEFNIIVRPHPMTRRHNPKKLNEITKKFSSYKNFKFEENISSKKSLIDSQIMISDWSGAALEFSFCTGRPVLFIDVPRKINNPEYEKLGITPFEVQIRFEIGEYYH